MGLAPSLRLPLLRLHPEPHSGTVPLACTAPQAAAWCLIQFRCASPRSARSTPRGTEPAQQNARTRQSPRPPHPGAQSGGREGPPVRLCAKGGQRPGRVGRGPPVCRTSLSRPLLAWQRAPTTCCYGGNNSSSVCGVMRDFHFLCCVGSQYSDFYNEVVLLLLLQKKKKTPFPSAPAAVPWSSSVGSPTRWRTGAGVSCRRSRRCCKTPNSISPLF